MPQTNRADKRPHRTGNKRAVALVAALACVTLAAVAQKWIQSSREKSLGSSTLVELTRLSASRPDDERVLYHLGVKQEESGDSRAAMNSYWHALQCDQYDESAWIAWARTTDAVLGPEQARQVIQTCLQALPNSARIYIALARIEQRAGNHKAAYAAAVRASSLDPTNAEAWRTAGTEAATSLRHEEARRAFAQAAKVAPGDWRDQAGLGDALSHLARRQDAIAAFREAARLAPNEGTPHLLLGTELLMAAATDSDIKNARTELQASRDRAASLPNTAMFQLSMMLGESYRRQRQWRSARDEYTRASEISPFEPSAHYNLARVYRGLGDSAAAARELASHAELDRLNREINVLALRVDVMPGDNASRLRLARLYASVGRADKAAWHYSKLAASGPSADTARREMAALGGSRQTSER